MRLILGERAAEQRHPCRRVARQGGLAAPWKAQCLLRVKAILPTRGKGVFCL